LAALISAHSFAHTATFKGIPVEYSDKAIKGDPVFNNGNDVYFRTFLWPRTRTSVRICRVDSAKTCAYDFGEVPAQVYPEGIVDIPFNYLFEAAGQYALSYQGATFARAYTKESMGLTRCMSDKESTTLLSDKIQDSAFKQFFVTHTMCLCVTRPDGLEYPVCNIAVELR